LATLPAKTTSNNEIFRCCRHPAEFRVVHRAGNGLTLFEIAEGTTMRAMIAAIALMLPGPLLAQETVLFTLGAGDVSGSYYASAFAICDVVNRTDAGQLRCSPEPTAGSIYNLDALRRGQIDFAMVQSDWQRSAYEGTGPYADIGPMSDLRSVMSLYSETLSVLVSSTSDIKELADLRGKRVDVGVPSSGRRATVDRILATLGYAPADFAALAELPAGVAIESLCSGSIDATLLIVGHPNAAVARALSTCGARLVPLTTAEARAVVDDNPALRKTIIPMTFYPDQTRVVDSVAVTSTVVTRAGTDAKTVAALVKDTVGNLDLLAQRAPVLSGLSPRAMRQVGLSAPLHPGAEAAFAEAGVP
jgi:TRAP transporter TAXI family solute receptor